VIWQSPAPLYDHNQPIIYHYNRCILQARYKRNIIPLTESKNTNQGIFCLLVITKPYNPFLFIRYMSALNFSSNNYPNILNHPLKQSHYSIYIIFSSFGNLTINSAFNPVYIIFVALLRKHTNRLLLHLNRNRNRLHYLIYRLDLARPLFSSGFTEI
jgi:hypothetical protein